MVTAAPRMVFVNLAVKDLPTSMEFFKRLGFAFNEQFTDETAACLVLSEQAFVMLVTEPRFKDFTKKPLCDARAQTEVLMGLSAASRQEVDELLRRALASGGAPAGDPLDLGSMYSASFQDPDGHIWELVWMDPSAIQQ